MGLWNDYVVICIKIFKFMVLFNDNVVFCIKIYNFKGSKRVGLLSIFKAHNLVK